MYRFIFYLIYSKVQEKVEKAEMTQAEIETTRCMYIPVANRARILFFCLSDLQHVDNMYQYSLEWFINIFCASMTAAEMNSQ